MPPIVKGYDDALVGSLAKEIQQAVRFSDDRLRAVLQLPPASKTDNETLCLAIQLVLERHFKLRFPPAQMTRVRDGQPVQFVEAGRTDGLPPRRVSILLAAEHRRIEIVGVEAENGEDGWSELRFRWQRQVGMEDERGNIDWKRLNTFPNVSANTLLAVLHPHTPGRAGIDAAGKKIKQRPGRPLKVRWDEATIEERPFSDTETGLFSRTAGIVDFIFARPGDPKTLQRIAITDTITINGNVDYRIGDQGSSVDKTLSCCANIVVKGDVLGIFSLQSEGFIHVRGAIEGRRVEAEEVKAQVITAGTTVVGRKSLVADNVVRARVEGGEVVIRRNVNGATVEATDAVRLVDGVACIGATFVAPRLQADGARFTGRNRIVLGADIFEREKTVLQDRGRAGAAINELGPVLRRAVEMAAEQLTALERILVRSCGSLPREIASQLGEVKKEFVDVVRKPEQPFPDAFFTRCRQLQTALGERNIHTSVLGKVDVFLRTVKPLQELLTELKERHRRRREVEERFADLRQRAAALEAAFHNIQFAAATSEIVIEAGGDRLVLQTDNLPDEDFVVVYRLPEDPDRIAGGSLDIDQEVAAF